MGSSDRNARHKDRNGLLRARDGGRQHVSPFELFFDLVFVFAVTQLSHTLLDHLTVRGALETLLMLLVVWSAWVSTTWVANWFDPDQLPVRLMLIAVMLASLFMSVAIPEAFDERALMFAGAYASIHVGRAGFAYLVLHRSSGPSSPLTRTFRGALIWHVAAGVLWVLGGAMGSQAQYLCWILALAMNLVAPLTGYYIPGLGGLRTSEWTVHGVHLAERFRLFIILALGESLVLTGTAFAAHEPATAAVAAFVIAFTGSVGLWWIYFHHSAHVASDAISSADDPGRLARAYTYFHFPMVAGIIAVAAADELTVAHPAEHGTPASVLLTFGGPALFLLGHWLFMRAVAGRPPKTHMVATAALCVLAPAGLALPTLASSAAAGLIVVVAAVRETQAISHASRSRSRTPE